MRKSYLLNTKQDGNPVDVVCFGLGDGTWHSCTELAAKLLLPVEFIKDVCLFLEKYGFADFRGSDVRLYSDQPPIGEVVNILIALVNGAILHIYTD